MTKRILTCLLALVMIAGVMSVTALAAGNAAKVSKTEYATLDDAVKAAKSGSTIELLRSDVLTFDNIGNKSLTFTGNGTITVKNQTKNGYSGDLKFDGEGVVFQWIGSSNGSWLQLAMSGSLTFSNGAAGIFSFDSAEGTNCAIYMSEKKSMQINVENGSSLSIYGQNTKGVAGQGIQLGKTANTHIRVTGNSTFLIDGTNRGYVNSPSIWVEDSTFIVQNCTSNASNGGDFTAINSKIYFLDNWGHGLSGTHIDIRNSTLNAINNGLYGMVSILSGSLKIDSTSKVKIEGNAYRDTEGDANRVKGALALQWGVPGTIEAGADVQIVNNHASGVYIMSGAKLLMNSSVIMNNRTINGVSEYGGGIYNEHQYGTVTLDPSVVLYNNHAETAGDDIYSTGTIAFAKVGSGWVLDDCDHRINGWYYDGDPEYAEDGTAKRWNAHGDEPFMEEFQLTDAAVTVTGTRALKAAHDLRVDDDLPALLAGLWLNTQDHYSYLIGYSDGTVRPNGKITRAEVATIFFRLLDDDTRAKYWSSENNFSDVSADKWYNNAVSTLSRMGVIGGYADGTFRPDAPISRAEFAKIAVSFTQNNGSAVYNYFTDVKTTDWFAPYVTAAKDAGLIEGYSDGSFKPESKITRAEACAIVNRTLGRKPSKAHMKISDRIDWPDVQTTDWFYEAIMEATNSHTYQMGKRVETWNDKLPQRDWAALETGWANAYTGNGGEVR